METDNPLESVEVLVTGSEYLVEVDTGVANVLDRIYGYGWQVSAIRPRPRNQLILMDFKAMID